MSVTRVETIYGNLIPKYGQLNQRSRNRASVIKYPSGNIKSLYLEGFQKVQTELGEIQAEMVTFYENQEIHRIFPTYGQISGFWSEEEERELIPVANHMVGNVPIRARVSGYCFYPGGNIKSVTLYPGEMVFVRHKWVTGLVRFGIGFFENEDICSLEPAFPILLETDWGNFKAFDNNAVGITGDMGSVSFWDNGKIKTLKSCTTGVRVKTKEGMFRISPHMVVSQLDISEMTVGPISYEFSHSQITVTDSDGKTYCFQKNEILEMETFEVEEMEHKIGCTSCSGCTSNCSSRK